MDTRNDSGISPRRAGKQIEMLRLCGVPDLDRALYSAETSATMIIQGALQPYRQESSGDIVTNQMHVHPLPWPREGLEELGEHPVKMRVTLPSVEFILPLQELIHLREVVLFHVAALVAIITHQLKG